ncbi:MAG: hypothetical protein KDC92_09330 [Bacteroidetes bacterium]|nr:hypothetical protein [Bacteroidota bacterium]
MGKTNLWSTGIKQTAMEAIKQVQQIRENVRLYRDFLDVLTLANQQKLNIIVPDSISIIDTLLDIKANPKGTTLLINNQYARSYSELRMYKGAFNNLGSLLTLYKLRFVNQSKVINVNYDNTLCYTTNNLRIHNIENKAKYLAVAIFEDSNYVSTKVFMRENMIELLSL